MTFLSRAEDWLRIIAALFFLFSGSFLRIFIVFLTVKSFCQLYKMACGEAGDVNILSRVGFSNHLPSQTPTTSLLTFADMVLALDNKGSNDVTDSTFREKNSKDDHTYASNKSHKMTTRSQALRINSQCPLLHEKHRHLELSDIKNDRTGECLLNSNPEVCNNRCNPIQTSTLNQNQCRSTGNHKSLPFEPNTNSNNNTNVDDKMYQEMDRKVKRSSSVENIMTEAITVDSFSEWPETSWKNSPRKSCSFEEVNRNSGSQKSDDRCKGGSSGQLHRLVNDTLEFPCWPRKADHTYATATWDGTAASHSLFEQELNQEEMKTEDLEMEVTEYVPQLRRRNLNLHCDEQHKSTYALQNNIYQKDDHTYVKQNANVSANSLFPIDSDSVRKSSYSCSTFPRQKCREDHTYFSSGLTKHGSGSSCGKDWNSLQTVTNISQNKEKVELANKHNVAPQLFSAKKDHNYSTSA